VDGPNTLTNQSAAPFGQLSWHLTDPWSVSAGVRYTQERKSFSGGQHDRNALAYQLGLIEQELGLPSGALGGVPLSQHPNPADPTLYFPPGELHANFSNTSFRAGTEYRLSDDVFTYVSFSQGFKSGGWDTRLTAPRLSVPGFAPETADTYEAGIKSEWLDRHVRVNAAAFFTNYKNLQLIIQSGISPLTRNAGESQIKGVELDYQWQVLPDLIVSGTGGWIDARYTKLDAAANASGIFLSNKFDKTPEDTASLALDYRPHLRLGMLAWHVDYAWKSGQYNDAVNTPELYQKAFGLLNASVTYTGGDGKWNIGVGGTNLTNVDHIVSGFNQPGIGYIIATRGQPSQWWAKLGVNF